MEDKRKHRRPNKTKSVEREAIRAANREARLSFRQKTEGDMNVSGKNETSSKESFSASAETHRTLPTDVVIGRNPVIEAIKSGHDINKLLVAEGEASGLMREILSLAHERGIVTAAVPKSRLETIAPGLRHQGVAAYVSPIIYSSLDRILSAAQSKETPPFLLVLDGIEDPHNLGALMRSADAFGIDGVIIPKRRSCPISAAVTKTSAGAAEYVPVARVGSIAQTLEILKDAGIWVAGADADAKTSCYDADLSDAVALVIGNEGKGLSRLVRERCDFLVNIPMLGHIGSLNASVAGSILIYESFKQRLAKEREHRCAEKGNTMSSTATM